MTRSAGTDLAAVTDRLRKAGSVFAEDEARLLLSSADTSHDLDAMVERRVSGTPLEQVLGWAEFCGRRIAVEPGVFVPRRRSELLVAEAVAAARRTAESSHPCDRALVVVDLCCGTGALGAAVAATLRGVELWAADVDAAAVRCARRNVEPRGGVAVQGDLYGPLPERLRGRVDVLLANVPYVPTDEIGLMPPEARLHEPATALDGGADGLDVLRRVSVEATRWLAPAGALLVETSERQASTAQEIFAAGGLVPAIAHDDDLGATVAVGTRADPTHPRR
jgi:release factor glutamine methyltransferase